MNSLESEMPLSPQEIAFLEEKKSSVQSYLILCVVGFFFNGIICFAVIEDLSMKYFLIFAVSVLFLIAIIRYWGKISDINKDLRDGVKKVLHTQIDRAMRKPFPETSKDGG